MRQTPTLTALLLATSGVLSACNSSERLYSQGPWGPAHIQRDYPRYDAPWGGRNAISSREAIPPAQAALMTTAARETAAYRAPVPGSHSDVLLPPDPIPSPPREITASQQHAALPTLSESMQAPSVNPSLPERANPPGVISAPSRPSAYAGNWKATDGQGNSCRVQLSSVSALDLYKASTSGCSNTALRSINAWSFRENNIILFSRGQVVARLSGEEASLTGALNGSGESVRMTR